MSELKPCPFCGARENQLSLYLLPQMGKWYVFHVMERDKGLCPLSGVHLLSAWNRRDTAAEREAFEAGMNAKLEWCHAILVESDHVPPNPTYDDWRAEND